MNVRAGLAWDFAGAAVCLFVCVVTWVDLLLSAYYIAFALDVSSISLTLRMLTLRLLYS